MNFPVNSPYVQSGPLHSTPQHSEDHRQPSCRRPPHHHRHRPHHHHGRRSSSWLRWLDSTWLQWILLSWLRHELCWDTQTSSDLVLHRSYNRSQRFSRPRVSDDVGTFPCLSFQSPFHPWWARIPGSWISLWAFCGLRCMHSWRHASHCHLGWSQQELPQIVALSEHLHRLLQESDQSLPQVGHWIPSQRCEHPPSHRPHRHLPACDWCHTSSSWSSGNLEHLGRIWPLTCEERLSPSRTWGAPWLPQSLASCLRDSRPSCEARCRLACHWRCNFDSPSLRTGFHGGPSRTRLTRPSSESHRRWRAQISQSDLQALFCPTHHQVW